MPPIAEIIFETASVAGSTDKTARFVAKRIMGLVDKRPKRFIRNVNTVGISIEFRAGCSVLEVIFAVMFVHPSTFNERFQENIVIIIAKPFPTVLVVMKANQLFALPYRLQRFWVDFPTVQRIGLLEP